MKGNKLNISKRNIIIGIIILICIVLLVVIIKQMGSSEDKKPKKEMEGINVTDENIDVLIGQFRALSDVGDLDVILNDRKVNASDINSNDAYYVAYYRDSFNQSLLTKSSYSLNKYNDKVSEIFGSSYKLDYSQVDYKCSALKYDAKKKQLVTNPDYQQCLGVDGIPKYEYRMTTGIRNKDEIVIEVKVLFYNEKTGSFYKDYNMTQKVDDDKFNWEEREAGKYGVPVAVNVYDFGTTYYVKFKQEKGHYVFVSAEPLIEEE